MTPASIGVDVDAYTKVLVSYAEQIGDVSPLEQERDALFVKLQNGSDGKTLESSSVNGKNFGWKITITLEEKFRAFVNAIKAYNGAEGDSPITFPDFASSSQRFPLPPDSYPWMWPVLIVGFLVRFLACSFAVVHLQLLGS